MVVQMDSVLETFTMRQHGIAQYNKAFLLEQENIKS